MKYSLMLLFCLFLIGIEAESACRKVKFERPQPILVFPTPRKPVKPPTTPLPVPLPTPKPPLPGS